MYFHSLPDSNQPPVLTIHTPALIDNIIVQGDASSLTLSATDPDPKQHRFLQGGTQ
jgi:hypothetical protein